MDERDAARHKLVMAMQDAAGGDALGVRRVYDLTSAKLFGICLRICGDRQAAEDVLQDVYVKVWRRAGAFDAGRASPISWLAMIARNAAIDWVRREGRATLLPQSHLDAVPDDRPGADNVLGDAQQAARLHACLDGLEPDQSIVIRRAFLDGMSYPDLAQSLGRPLGTIKSWARRGMAKLKDCLGDD